MMNRINDGEYDPQALPSALVNKSFPTFSLPRLEQLGTTVTDKDLLGEILKTEVIYYFNLRTWESLCPKTIGQTFNSWIQKETNFQTETPPKLKKSLTRKSYA